MRLPRAYRGRINHSLCSLVMLIIRDDTAAAQYTNNSMNPVICISVYIRMVGDEYASIKQRVTFTFQITKRIIISRHIKIITAASQTYSADKRVGVYQYEN